MEHKNYKRGYLLLKKTFLLIYVKIIENYIGGLSTVGHLSKTEIILRHNFKCPQLKRVTLGYFEAQSRVSLRLIIYFHLLTEAIETKL